MAHSQPTLLSLAALISDSTRAITSHLNENGHALPSFEEDGLKRYPHDPELRRLRLQLVEAASDLYQLAVGAADMCFLQPMLNNHDTMTLDLLNQFDFFTAIPLGGSATYEEISDKTRMPLSLVQRILRHAMTMRLFSEKPPGSGRIVHTAATSLLCEDSHQRSWVGHNLEVIRPATMRVPESIKKFSVGKDRPCQDVLKSGFALADLDGLEYPSTFWQYTERDQLDKPEGFRSKRFAEAMQAAAATSAIQAYQLLTTAYDWNGLGEVTVVDVGGSTGHDAKVLATDFPSLRLIVQDKPQNEGKFQNSLPPDLEARVSFQAHDFFTPQNVKAEVFLLKMVLHDWSDQAACAILRNLIPALKPGGRILLCENVAQRAFSEQGSRTLPYLFHRLASSFDLQMLTVFNTLERGLKQWTTLVTDADERLRIHNVFTLPGAVQSIIEVVLDA
ncbi:O-methyltransferase-domain-containing protein [Dactylonectria macrodidyma]|uniref:O-methyltransferase-domain-containing protein n=1 Tax=Dactylonectria macrodidyma TaxID=307937 RepID=A0A9P9II96_9HYPO|nr:O-methyltransferase-domain-containing protein [Dactylonectria macrodidyma]